MGDRLSISASPKIRPSATAISPPAIFSESFSAVAIAAPAALLYQDLNLSQRVLRDFANEETARILEISVANVKTRLHRARMALREQLSEITDRIPSLPTESLATCRQKGTYRRSQAAIRAVRGGWS